MTKQRETIPIRSEKNFGPGCRPQAEGPTMSEERNPYEGLQTSEKKEEPGITGDKAANRLDSCGELVFDSMTGNR